MKRLRLAGASVVDAGVRLAAGGYRGRAVIVDAAGGLCAVVAGSHVSPAVAWGVAAVWLSLRAAGMDRSKS